ncbi:MlaD family protein [Nocardia sp. NBC_00565]|uniref:MlaD family protein n=1 Tax=Nocardia sp. NBC_00565 TaxID=2975993 RepID=UPI002E8248D4|nr:MlaD family protein [Nocardia sp. NBC_00565]WUC04731.1 MlaD family protein [Nocardia sp. NBC_00565]
MRGNSQHRRRSAIATAFFDPAPRGGVRPGWWSVLSILVVGGLVWATVFFFTGSQHRSVQVRLQSDRSGLVMERGAKVKLRGAEVGQVGAVDVDAAGHASLQLKLSGDAVRRIPANIRAEIKPTTIFGAKYVSLVDPENPSTARISAGAVLRAENVTTEVNTVFEAAAQESGKHEVHGAQVRKFVTKHACVERLRQQFRQAFGGQ